MTFCGIMTVWQEYRQRAKGEEAHTFSRSIVASAAIRVSQMRLTNDDPLFAFVWGEVEPCGEVTGKEMSQP